VIPVLAAVLLVVAAAGAQGAVLYDCPPLRRALLPLAGLDRMPEDRVARFANPPEFLCSDVNAESIVVYPGRARRGRQALEVIGTFVERPAGGSLLRHALRAELLDGETVVASADAPPWESARPTRSVVKLSLEVGEARLREVLSRSDPPLLRLTLDLSPPKP
jgi:hypothetical protein